MRKPATGLSSVMRLGLDLAQHVFQVHAVDADGREIDKRALRRGRLIADFTAQACVSASAPPCLRVSQHEAGA